MPCYPEKKTPKQEMIDRVHVLDCILCNSTGKLRDAHTDQERTCVICNGKGVIRVKKEG